KPISGKPPVPVGAESNGRSPLLVLDGVETFYGAIQALKGVSFTVPEGSIVTLLGANGAGKSTTLKCISGLVPAARGTVSFRGQMAEPALMLLDEPSLGLAPMLVEEIFAIIRGIHAGGTTVLLVEQNANKALSIADYGYVLETGTIVLAGDSQQLLKDDRVRRAYLGQR